MTAAPTCTEGPSRPTDAPINIAKKVSGIFQIVCQKITKRLLSEPCGRLIEAITCGIPLPDT